MLTENQQKSMAVYANKISKAQNYHKNIKIKDHSLNNIIFNKEKPQYSNLNNSKGIYEAIINQMEPTLNKYVKGLIIQNERQTEKSTIKANQAHERAKSYADRSIDTQQKFQVNQNQTLKSTTKFNPREERDTHKKLSAFQDAKYFSRQGSPKYSVKKLKQDKSTDKEGNQTNQTNCFISNIDNYLKKLKNHQKNKCMSYFKTVNLELKNNYMQQLKQNKTLIRELKVVNQILFMDKKKQSKKERLMKDKMIDMLEEIRYLNSSLDYQKREKKKIQKFYEKYEINKLKKKKNFGCQINDFIKNVEQQQNEDFESNELDLNQELSELLKKKKMKNLKNSSLTKTKNKFHESNSRINRQFKETNGSCSSISQESY